jgi:signal transduction histidine kinase
MSLQNVVWLHRQAVAPAAEHGSGTLLPQVVRLADILVRQQGFAYPPWESVTESATEAAERLGLSNASAEQIAHQVVEVFEMNAQPTGLLDEPSKADLWPTLAVANAHLGRRYRAARAGEQASQVQANRAELLITLNGRLATCTSARDVLQTVAATARESLELRVVVPYLVGREKDYVEGILATPDTAGEHFLYAINSHEGIETLMPDAVAATLLTVPTRAERIEDWLFERQGPRLGEGPFFTVPMIVEGAKVGGIVFAFHGPARDLTARESAALTALAGMAGVALKRVQAEADLVMLTEELAEVNRELQAAQDERVRQRNVASMGEMAAGAAHEINNPLAIISGRAQQLAGTEQDPAGREMLRTIIQQAQRISDIIADLHLFARPPVPDLRTVDPIELAQQVADEMAAEGTPAQLRVDAPEPVPAIWVDPQQVAAALKEIVRNAVEACSNGYGGEVTISVQAAAGEAAVRLAVIDSGPGMAPEVRARALDPFYCGHKAGRHRGLGLPKAYRAVQANGGQMAMESAPGRGTTVRMIFPVAAGKS